MTTDEAIKFYGGKMQLATALGIWPQTVYQWGEFPPMSKQYEIEVRSGGKLKAGTAVRAGNAGDTVAIGAKHD